MASSGVQPEASKDLKATVTIASRGAEVRTTFEKDTAKHTMTVLRDDGLYRHLRFKSPASAIYHFDLVSWPGHLAITGDAGDFLFARTADMFSFFEVAPQINPDYWSEKLVAPAGRRGVREFSRIAYEQSVRSWAAEQSPEVAKAAIEELITGDVHSEHQAQEMLRDFRLEGTEIHDAWEWDLTEFSFRFLWCCWAIRSGISRYRAHQADTPASAA